jgi:hypothetical protein
MITDNSIVYKTIIGVSIVLAIAINYAVIRILYVNCKKDDIIDSKV